MAEKKYFWLKLKDDFFRDKRIKKLRRIAGGDTYTIIYLKMQLLSLKSGGALVYEGVEPTFEEEIALEIDEEIEDVKVALLFLSSNGLLEETEQDHYIMPETIKCIGSESSSAERVRKHREIKREELKALQCNARVTNCNTDIEIDIDKEIDTDKEKSVEKKDDTPLDRFCKAFNIAIDNYSAMITELDYEKLTKAYNESKWLQMNITSLSKICRDYQRIIGGYYKDYKDVPKKNTAVHFQMERDYDKDFFDSIYADVDDIEI